MKRSKKLCSILLALVMLCGILPTFAQADGGIRCYAETVWRVSNNSNSNIFTVRRSGDLTRTETVYYRTVSLTAVEGQHFTRKTGSLTFGPNEDAISVAVTELNNLTGAYAYQVGTTRKYRFEVCDAGGFYLASADREITKGTSVSENALKWISVDVAAGPVTVSDSGYAQAYHAVQLNDYFSEAPKGYLQLIGAHELHMFVDLETAEKEDGYQYIQIYVNDTSNVDTGAGSGEPGTVSYSAYAAGFGHDPGDKNTTYYKYRFPVASVGNQAGAETPWSGLNNTVGKLYKQKFNSSRRSSDDGYLRLSNDQSTDLNTLAELNTVGIRLNASGNNSDTWYAKNIKASIKATDTRTPQPDMANIVVAPGPGSDGNYRKDNLVYVTVPFNEIVVSQGQPFLETTWGNLGYEAGLGTNVLTFKGKAPSGNGITRLSVKGITTNSIDVKDLADNVLNKTFTKKETEISPVADYSYTVEYELRGGENPSDQVTNYTYRSDAFTLQEPYRVGYVFTGWTGTNGSTPQKTVTVGTNSHGDRRYIANWSESFIWGIDIGADGSEQYPYLIRTPEELTALRDWVNRGTTFSETYFRLGSNINMTGVTFDSIGTIGKPFQGNFDGFGYTISNLNATLGLFGRTESGAISNLTLDHAAVSKSIGYVGALAGYADHTAINNCVVANSTVSSNSADTAGLVGYADYATINNCAVVNTTVSGSNDCGGFAGYSFHATINNCVVADSTVSGSSYVGGFCGNLNCTNSSGSLDCLVIRTSTNGNGTKTGAVNGAASISSEIYKPYNYNCTINGSAPSDNSTTTDHTVYTVTAGSGIAVSGTAVKTYENVNFYQKNAEITLAYTGEVPEGCELAYAVNGTQIEGNTFNLTSDATVTATLGGREQYLVTAQEYDSSTDNGQVFIGDWNSEELVYEGSTVTAFALPDNGNIVASWTVLMWDELIGDYIYAVPDISHPTPNTISFTMPSADVLVSATFSEDSHQRLVFINDMVGGKVVADKTLVGWQDDEPVTLTILPDNGYRYVPDSLRLMDVDRDTGAQYDITPYMSTVTENSVYSIRMDNNDLFVYADFEADSILVAAHSLSLNGDIGVNFYAMIPNVTDAAYAELTVNSETVTVPIDLNKTTEQNGVTLYKFTCNVAAAQIDTEITGKIYSGDMESEEFTYTVQDYLTEAQRTMANDEKFMALAGSLATYGWYANELFGFDPEFTQHALFDDSGFAGVTASSLAENAAQITDTADGVTYFGTSLVLRTETAIKHYFTLPAGKTIGNFTFMLGEGDTAVTLTPKTSGNLFFAEIPNVGSGDLGKAYTVTVLDGNGNAVNAWTYSALSYVYKALTKAQANDPAVSAELANVSKALTLYSQAADAYFHPQEEPQEPQGYSFLLTDNFNWGQALVYAWDADGNPVTGDYPGTQAESMVNDYGETQFIILLPENAAGCIVGNGFGALTEEITDFSYTGYWMDGTQNDQGHYIVTGWN